MSSVMVGDLLSINYKYKEIFYVKCPDCEGGWRMICILCGKDQASGMIYELDIGRKFICSACDRNNEFINRHSLNLNKEKSDGK